MKHMAELWLRQEVRELEEEAVADNLALVIVDGPALAQVTWKRSLRHIYGCSGLNEVVSWSTNRNSSVH